MTDESVAAAKPDPRVFCFERPEDDDAFERSVMRLVAQLNERTRETLVSRQNVMRMNHGRNWVHAARDPEPDTSMHSITAEWLIPFREIADNDLSLIGRSILPMSEEMSRQFAQNMYRVVGEAAEQVGNVVSAENAGSVSQSLIEMMSKIELGVDRDGNVSMPQIHAGTEAHAKLVAELENMAPEVAAELERLRLEKTREALDREAERRAKFRSTET
ncbi:MAG TPA: hypothetical protein VFQ67_09640 [Allosphingosinicella sp.]|jgi:hypothetical protein|nr:hypothetical protein [Allosphingosinicella sp.]